MGISIHYKGNFRKEANLREMMDEVIDTCKTLEWNYHEFIDFFPRGNAEKMLLKNEAFGLCFSPPNCEPVFLSFLSDGRFCNPFLLEHLSNPPTAEDIELLTSIHVKTHFAGPEVHKKVLNLLRYLNEKYFSNFELHDEAKYWETEDEKYLLDYFAECNKLFNDFEKALNGTERNADETVEEFILRVAGKFKA